MMTTLPELSRLSSPGADTLLRCIVCKGAFDFAAGETATVLHHIAYGYDFAHPGACLAAALEWIFVEPGYDRPAFSVGRERVRVLRTGAADSWATDLPEQPHTGAARRWWALVEHGDGSRRVETITRDPEWQDEPGAAEFHQARGAGRASLDYVLEGEGLPEARRARSATDIQARYRAEQPALRRSARPC